MKYLSAMIHELLILYERSVLRELKRPLLFEDMENARKMEKIKDYGLASEEKGMHILHKI